MPSKAIHSVFIDMAFFGNERNLMGLIKLQDLYKKSYSCLSPTLLFEFSWTLTPWLTHCSITIIASKNMICINGKNRIGMQTFVLCFGDKIAWGCRSTSQTNYALRLIACLLVHRNFPLPKRACPILIVTMNEWYLGHDCVHIIYSEMVTMIWPRKWVSDSANQSISIIGLRSTSHDVFVVDLLLALFIVEVIDLCWNVHVKVKYCQFWGLK